ncbi:MAG: YeeE/YedE family protein [Verrucomicrobiales bacterium]|nr:YeeE/YedE family protein [Verrucomicrobiales bacterium]MBP9223867.1 YeeE/YedE family protein [Verrucomicrobiales bacterium]
MFEDPLKLLLGLMTGIVFGVLLQKGQVAKFQKILGQFLLQDFTVIKIMATAIAVGTLGVHALIAMGMADLHVQTASLARVIGGGILFGVGLAVFGLCPGTSVAACGEGRRDAMVGVVGMMVGAGIYVAAFPALEPLFQSMDDYGKVTLPQITNSSPWIWAVGLALVIAIALALLERARARNPRPRG